jgi:hypothetical protein
MAQKIEPIEIWYNGEIKIGDYLRVYTTFDLYSNILLAEILDIHGNTLFTKKIYAKTINDVANQLNLTIVNGTI